MQGMDGGVSECVSGNEGANEYLCWESMGVVMYVATCIVNSLTHSLPASLTN